jgi:hypothetical protein
MDPERSSAAPTARFTLSASEVVLGMLETWGRRSNSDELANALSLLTSLE